MKTISQVLSSTTQTNDASAGIPVTKKTTKNDRRKKPQELENVYKNIPVVFNSINKVVQLILSKEWEIKGENSSFFRKFLDRVGHVGGNEHWSKLVEAIFRYQAIYGECFIELIENKDGDKIVDLALIDPKSISYAKASDSSIALDKYSNPVGYVQEIDFTSRHDIGRQKRREKEEALPENVQLSHGADIFIPRENVAHFKMYTTGEGFYPTGLIEPTFEAAERAFQLQEDFANKAHSALFPLRVAKVGDERHEPNAEQIQEMLKNLREASSSTEVALPYYVNIDMLEADNPEAMIEFFNHFRDSMINAMGVPKAIATGAGENVNRATLRRQSKVFQESLKDIMRRTFHTIEHQIFRPIAEKEGLDGYPGFELDVDDSVENVSMELSDGEEFEIEI